MTDVEDQLAAGRAVDTEDIQRTKMAVLDGLFGRTDSTTPARYAVERTLGRGAMGRVELARDVELGRRVALKTVVPERAHEAASLTRMKREAHALAQIDHPAVVGVHDLFEADGQVVIVMEYVEGPTLGQWLKGAPARNEVLAVLRAAAQGLAAAHRAGIVHRDFKPENVIVSAPGWAKVVDFGLARRGVERAATADGLPLEDGLSSSLTRTGAAVGTPAYMAPEQILRGHADARSDQFSFCVAAWESLTGARPFAGRSMQSIALNMAEGVIEPDGMSMLPRGVRMALLRGLRPEPAERHADMDSLARALEPRRVPWVALGAIGLGATVAVAGAWIQPGPRSDAAATVQTADPCIDAGVAIAGVWNEARRVAITSTILAAAPGYGAPFARRYVALVDAWTDVWLERAQESCRAGHDNTFSAELRSRSQRCLGDLAAELDGQLRAAGGMPASRISRIVRQLDALADPRVCLDPGSLRARWGEAPTDAERTARTKRAEARALLATGDYPNALRVARAARGSVPAGQNDVLDAELALTLGRALFQAGETAAAQRAFLDAANAAEASRYDELATLAWLEQVRVASLQKVDAADAEFLLERADAAVRRLGDPPRLRGIVHHRRAQACVAAGAFDDALTELDAADAAVATLDPSIRQHAELAIERGRIAYARGRFPQAIEAFSAAASGFEEWYGPHHPAVADAKHNLGSIMVAAGRLEEADGMLAEALEGRRQAYGLEHEKVAGTLNSIASVSYMRGHYADALVGYQDVLRRHKAARDGPHATIAETLANVGRAHRGLAQHDQAAAAFEEAVAMLEGLLGPEHPRLAESLTGWASALDAAGATSQALSRHERALELRTASLGPMAPRTLESVHNVGVCERKLGRLGAARRRAKRLRSAPEASASLRAYGALLAGWVEVDAGRESLARQHFEAGLVAYEEEHDAAREDAELEAELDKARAWLETPGAGPPAR